MNPYYEQDGITIYHGDCREVLPGLECGWGRPIIATDPPYLTDGSCVPVRAGGVAARVEDTTSVGMPWGYSLDWIPHAAALDPSHWLIYCNYRMLGGVQRAIEGYAKLGCTFIWRKTNAPRMTRPVPRFDCEFVLWFRHHRESCRRMGEFGSMVLDVPMPQAGCMASERIVERDSGKAVHQCQKPLGIVQPFIDRVADPGNLVIDPYMGTGTTLLAAKRAGARSIGIEISERYCEIAANRLRQGVLFGAGTEVMA